MVFFVFFSGVLLWFLAKLDTGGGVGGAVMSGQRAFVSWRANVKLLFFSRSFLALLFIILVLLNVPRK